MQLKGRHIGIAGTGLIGASIGASLVQAGFEVYGWDRDEVSLSISQENDFICHRCNSFEDLMVTDILIISLPMGSMALEPVGSNRPKVVLDTASVRGAIEEDLQRIWGERHCGFHPMAGKEGTGATNASFDLIKDATVAIVPGQRTSDRSKETAIDLARIIRGNPLVMTSYDHDRTVASISHLPMFLATALSLTAHSMGDLELMKKMAAGGFKDTSRVASCQPWLISEVWKNNRSHIEPLLNEAIKILSDMKESSPASLYEKAQQGKKDREDILASQARRI